MSFTEDSCINLFDTLAMEVKRVFGNEDKLKEEFHPGIQKPGNTTFPKFIFRALRRPSAVWNGQVCQRFADYHGASIIIWKGARFRPNMYEYMLRQIQSWNIVPSNHVAFRIDGRINVTDESNKTAHWLTLVRMANPFYFAKQMIPAHPTVCSFGIHPMKIQVPGKIRFDLGTIHWRQFVVLHQPSVKATRYLGRAPKTTEVGTNVRAASGNGLAGDCEKLYEKQPGSNVAGVDEERQSG